MVQIAASSKRKYKVFLGVKLRTIATTSIGLAVLVLVSLEPPIHYDRLDREGPSSTFNLRPPNPKPTRFGFVPRAALRTNVLHEMDMLKESNNERADAVTKVVSRPRIVQLDDDTTWQQPPSHNSTTTTQQSKTKTTTRTVPAMGKPCCHRTADYFVNDFERPFLNHCSPMVQPTVHPTCNNLHELALESDISLLSTKGSWRTAWKVDTHPVVLKLLNWNRRFDHQSSEAHAMDAMIMDRLTASPHVIDAYGFCGQSVLTEWAPTGGREHVKSYDLKNRQRLKVARDLARGLADLQALRPLSASSDYTSHHDGKGNELPVFAHNDINIANTVQVDGQIKWNDFNIGVLLRTQNTNATEMCGSPVRFQADLWRSPEEIRNTSYVRLEQTDVYGFGNILYQTMTRHQPWTHKEPEGTLSVDDVAARKRLGRLPTIPEQYKNTTKPELQALLLATMSCYHPNPDKRPTAYELAKGLSLVYDRLSHKKKVTPIFLRDLFVKQ